MPPRDTEYIYGHVDTLQERAAIELEAMRDCNKQSSKLHPLPPACALLLRSLPGNNACMDCGARHPEWATVSYGALICLECSGRHRSLGVQVRDNNAVIENADKHNEPHFFLFPLLTDFKRSIAGNGSLVTRTSVGNVGRR